MGEYVCLGAACNSEAIVCVTDALKVIFYFNVSSNKIDGSKEYFNLTVFTRLC